MALNIYPLQYKEFVNHLKNIKISKNLAEAADNKDFAKLLEYYNKYTKRIQETKKTIINISLKCDPALINKVSKLNYEKQITKKIYGGFLANDSLISAKSLFRDGFNLKDHNRWIKIRYGFVKMSKDMTTGYPFLSMTDRIEPAKPLEAEVENIFKSVYKYWDGHKWIKPTRRYSDLKKLKNVYLEKGFKWPELNTHDFSLHEPIVAKPSPRVMHSIQNNRCYADYVKKIVRLHGEIARTSRKLRNVFSDIPKRVVYPSLWKMGYSFRYLQYAHEIPKIKKNIMKLLTDEREGKVDKIKKYSMRMKALTNKKKQISQLKVLRGELLKDILVLDHKRNIIYNVIKNADNEVARVMKHSNSIHKDAALFALRKTYEKSSDNRKNRVRKQIKGPSIYYLHNKKHLINKFTLKHHSVARQFARLHPDEIRSKLTNKKNYDQQRKHYLHWGVKHSYHFKPFMSPMKKAKILRRNLQIMGGYKFPKS